MRGAKSLIATIRDAVNALIGSVPPDADSAFERHTGWHAWMRYTRIWRWRAAAWKTELSWRLRQLFRRDTRST